MSYADQLLQSLREFDMTLQMEAEVERLKAALAAMEAPVVSGEPGI